ncbi:MAG: hypothetical protein FWD15_01220 [Alphaproteobacteria bacterium]|nr:hypothetical protein [Alphaproteobacteria bacterium]
MKTLSFTMKNDGADVKTCSIDCANCLNKPADAESCIKIAPSEAILKWTFVMKYLEQFKGRNLGGDIGETGIEKMGCIIIRDIYNTVMQYGKSIRIPELRMSKATEGEGKIGLSLNVSKKDMDNDRIIEFIDRIAYAIMERDSSMLETAQGQLQYGG